MNDTSPLRAVPAAVRTDMANAIRALAMDAVQKANSGHPGMPMGMAEVAVALWGAHLSHNPADPHWPNRDRFVLSNGHGSMLQYALLHLTGYDLPIEELENFRQLHSRTPGHPEVGVTPGVETTTGPLGQGLANAVGMALAERLLAHEFNRPGFPLVDHHTYVFLGDGCLMEGISHEAASLAGVWQLAKLIAIYDDNGISIDGEVDQWFGDDTAGRFRSYGWNVVGPVDGHDVGAVDAAIGAAKLSDRPSLIIARTVIGKGSPNRAGTEKAHGEALGEPEIAATRAMIGWPHAPFRIPADIYRAWDARADGARRQARWQKLFDGYARDYASEAAEFHRRMEGSLPAEFTQVLARAIEAAAQVARDSQADSLSALIREHADGNDATIAQIAAKAIKKLEGHASGTSDQLRAARATLAGSPAASADTNVRTMLMEAPPPPPSTAASAPPAASSAAEPPGLLDISTLEPGDVIEGRYKFIQKIGKGAFGTVLLVEDTVVDDRLILKFLNPNVASDEEMLKRFVHELRYSRKITHKNVIRIYDFLALGGGYAISMEYFPSHTLGTEIAKEKPMNPKKAIGFACDICTGMAIAHHQGIVHRDLKPANILINDEGLLKIVDFGVAAAASSGDTQLTKTGYVIGSPKYMAPEQILGKKVDETADVYSIGVIMYEMTTGVPPYSRGDHMSVMYQHVQGKAKLCQEINAEIPDEFAAIIAKAMSVDKTKRFQSMDELNEALDALTV